MRHTIRKPAHFSQQDSLTPIHLLGSSGPGDHGKAASKAVQQKWVRVWSLSPMDSDESNLDSATNEVSLGDNLNETDWSQLAPCNSHESSPVSSDEPLGESLFLPPLSDSSMKKSRQHKRSKKCKLKLGMFAKHTFAIKKPQLWPHSHLDPHFMSHMPKFQDISWDQLVVGEAAFILQTMSCTQAMGRLWLLMQLAY